MEDDILEFALTNGVFAAADKYGLHHGEVRKIVKRFSADCTIHTECSCQEMMRKNPWISIGPCQNCDQGLNRRIHKLL